MSQTTFLFRLDGSRDNDEFMKLRRDRCGNRLYAGTPMKIGPGWIPDFVEVSIEGTENTMSITLIELEANESVARESCRKYLAEESADVLVRFEQFLDTVLAQCRTTADPRAEEFQLLKTFMAKQPTAVVRTAAALRKSADFLEVLPLLDQPDCSSHRFGTSQPVPESRPAFAGVQSLSRRDIDGLRRVVVILHAALTGNCHSGGTLDAWRKAGRKVLKTAIDCDAQHLPELQRLIVLTTQSGSTLDCDKIMNELAVLWGSAELRFSTEQGIAHFQGFQVRSQHRPRISLRLDQGLSNGAPSVLAAPPRHPDAHPARRLLKPPFYPPDWALFLQIFRIFRNSCPL